MSPELYGGVTIPGKPCPSNVQRLDLMALPALYDMMRYGTAIDRDACHELASNFGMKMRDLRKQITSYIPDEKLDSFCEVVDEIGEDGAEEWDYVFNPNRREKLAELLFGVMDIGVDKTLKTTKAGKISTGKKQMEGLKEDHPVVPITLEYAMYSKLRSTYAIKLPTIAVRHPAGNHCPVCGLAHWHDTHRVHTDFLPSRTTTRRFACVAEWTPIKTQRGQIPIREVVIGDYVWTHKNRWRKVIGTWLKGWEEMYHVRFNNGNTLTCTKSHQLLISDYGLVETLDRESNKYREDFEDVQVSRTFDHVSNSRQTGNSLREYSGISTSECSRSGEDCVKENSIS